MSKALLFFIAALCLPLLRVAVLNSHFDMRLESWHYDHGAAFIRILRDSPQFNAFIGGWVFPPFIALVLFYWIIMQEKERIQMQFMLLPLAYIPFSIIGFTLVNAEFLVSYLYVNTLIILVFGYAYVFMWQMLAWLLTKIGLVQE